MYEPRKDKNLPIRIGILSFILGIVLTLGFLSYKSEDDFTATEFLNIPVLSKLVTDEPYPVRKVWRPVNSTTPNVSHFIYRDVNRNGIYDIGDRPMVDIAVRLTRPDGSQVTRRSNIHGFVNFTNSMTANPVDVSQPGEYIFEVLIPDGWVLTSNNALQTAQYEVNPKSRPGIVSDLVPVPAGLAQRLTISGQIAKTDGAKNGHGIQLTATSKSGSKQNVLLDRDGQFLFEVEPDDWLLEATSDVSVKRVVREVQVQQAPVRLSTLVLDDVLPEPVSDRYKVDFENITLSRITKMPNGPAGLQWQNLIPVENEFYGGEGYINNTLSGNYIGYNTSGYPVTISSQQGFNFHGGYFGVAWREVEGEILHIRAWRGEKLVGSESYALSALGPFWFDADYHNITRLELSTEHYWQFVVDDLSFSMP